MRSWIGRIVKPFKTAVLPFTKKYINPYFHCGSVAIGALLLIAGYIAEAYNVILCGILICLLSNLIYGFQRWRKRLIFLVFHFVLFTFLIARPTISMLRGYEWWYFGRQSTYFALNMLWITLAFLRLGSMLYERFESKLTGKKLCVNSEGSGYDVYIETPFIKYLRRVSLAFFAITTVFYWMIQVEKLMFIQGHDYAEIYISYTSKLPWFVFTLSDMMIYGLCIFLATFPKKRWCYGVLSVYVLGTVPSLIIGVRNPIVLALIFCFVYFLLRDILENRSHWVGKFERIMILVAVPAAIIFLSFYNYVREGEAVSMGVGQSIVDFFYKQGSSFDVLCRAYDAIPRLPKAVPKNYTFGPMIDYIGRGSIGQALFGLKPLGTLNSEALAIYGNSFSHSMSYVVHPAYLQGHGYGSSYVLEFFADWGYMGVALGSAVLGFVMRSMTNLIKKGPVVRTIVFLGLTSLFFIPRAEATKWISFVVMMQFWLAVLFCFALAKVLTKKDDITNWFMDRSAKKEK